MHLLAVLMIPSPLEHGLSLYNAFISCIAPTFRDYALILPALEIPVLKSYKRMMQVK